MILRPTYLEDVIQLSRTLRDCDRAEIALGSGLSPFKTLSNSWASSDFCVTIETPSGAIAGIWGVAPVLPCYSAGSIWMLGSDELDTIPTSFLKACRPAIARAHALYPLLICAPWRGNSLHLRWLRWLGFSLTEVGHPHFLKASRHV